MCDTIGLRIDRIIQNTTVRKVRFAEALDIDQSYISRLIAGKGTPSDRIIRDICREFNVNEEWLRNGGDDSQMFNPQPDSDQAVIDRIAREYNLGSPVFRALAESYLRLDEPHRKALDRIIEQFVAAYQSAKQADRPEAPPDDIPLKQTGIVHTGGRAIPVYDAAPDDDLHTRYAAKQELREMADADPETRSAYPVLNDTP